MSAKGGGGLAPQNKGGQKIIGVGLKTKNRKLNYPNRVVNWLTKVCSQK